MSWQLRDMTDMDVPDVISLWHKGWHEAHASITPIELVDLRTPSSFAERLQRHKGSVRIAVAEGMVCGLCMPKKDELFQLYVSPMFRGVGLALRLMSDAEDHFRREGYKRVWLACAIGNERAAKFYNKAGWIKVRTEKLEFDTATGTFPLEVWRYEKDL